METIKRLCDVLTMEQDMQQIQHAKKCLDDETSGKALQCSWSDCKPMRQKILHMSTCRKPDCPVNGCLKFKERLRDHEKMCKRFKKKVEGTKLKCSHCEMISKFRKQGYL